MVPQTELPPLQDADKAHRSTEGFVGKPLLDLSPRDPMSGDERPGDPTTLSEAEYLLKARNVTLQDVLRVMSGQEQDASYNFEQLAEVLRKEFDRLESGLKLSLADLRYPDKAMNVGYRRGVGGELFQYTEHVKDGTVIEEQIGHEITIDGLRILFNFRMRQAQVERKGDPLLKRIRFGGPSRVVSWERRFILEIGIGFPPDTGVQGISRSLMEVEFPIISGSPTAKKDKATEQSIAPLARRLLHSLENSQLDRAAYEATRQTYQRLSMEYPGRFVIQNAPGSLSESLLFNKPLPQEFFDEA